MRGTGQRRSSKKPVRGKMFNDSTGKGPEAWSITFNYKDGGKETVTVIAPSYEKAMDEAFEERKRKSEKPASIKIVDPGVWKSIMGALKASGTYATKRARYALRKQIIMGMLQDAYTDDPVRRRAARIALRKEFPEVYEMCDFSRERR